MDGMEVEEAHDLVSAEEDGAEAGDAEHASKGAGRPVDSVRQYFKDAEGFEGQTKGPKVCKLCSVTIRDGRVAALRAHVIRTCKAKTAANRTSLISSASEKAPLPPPVVGKRSHQQTLVGSGLTMATKTTAGEQKVLDRAQLRCWVSGGLPWDFSDDPMFLDYVAALRPGYIPAGACKGMGGGPTRPSGPWMHSQQRMACLCARAICTCEHVLGEGNAATRSKRTLFQDPR